MPAFRIGSLVAVVLLAPTVAPTVAHAQIANLSVTVQPSRDPGFTWRSPTGPITLSSTSRGGSFRVASDYGATSATARARVLGLADTRNDVPPASSSAGWIDTLTLADPFDSGAAGVNAVFAFTSTMTVSATTASAMSGTLGLSQAEFQFFAGTEPTALARIIGRGRVTDTATGAPRQAYQVSTRPGFLYSFDASPSFSRPTVPTGPTRIEVGMFLPFGRALSIGMTSGCTIEMASFRILDSTAGQCASSTTFDGLVGLFDLLGNALDPGAYDGVGTSGFDYLRPVASQSMAVSSAPEPSAWAMLIIGFGLVGGVLRQRARAAVAR